jgi:hypothetical protein
VNPIFLAAFVAGLDCWAPTISQTVGSLAGTREAAGIAPLTAVLDKAESLLRADARVNALSGVRARLHRFIGHPARDGAPLMADASVWLHRRPEFWGPKCTLIKGADYTHHASISAHFNQLDPLYHLLENSQEVTEFGTFPLPAITGYVAGEPVYGGRVMLLTRRGVPAVARG